MLLRTFLCISHRLCSQNGINKLGITVQAAGLKHFVIPEKYNYELPPDNKGKRLPILPKVPLYPSNLKPFKMQKKLRLMRGPELVHNKLLHKQFGVIALSGGRLKYGHFEMVRWTCVRKLPEKASVIWRVPAPWQPVTAKTAGQRMGGGKGAISHYVTPIKNQRVIIEAFGPIEFIEVQKVLKEIADKLPFKAIAITQAKLDQIHDDEKYVEENNENPWTLKYIIQNNLGGCDKWIRPIDKYWFGKYR
ncbi:PREDICTED: 39S ribosomal protein L16, mitochondrial [Ceratosolen solmsi marchali]|uniref:Large ribosomal subunit protein uL16m n=1 Tax=Ceratosolen solmsi marchali TaxID=326594 RepID=A0AAJ7DV52_9HYME|nr:PREDICTED: 39S ribosomal protein L16, mitochondrial [Ceratosolen solmsi marchali]